MSGSEFPHRLKDLLGSVGTRLGVEDARATGVLWARWAEIVGESIAANAEPTSLKKGILRIRATSPTWAQELTYLVEEIKTRANEIAGSEVVREIRVWTGPGRVTQTTPRPAGGVHSGSAEGTQVDPPEATPENLEKAFEKARRAWVRRRSDRGS